MLLAYDLAKVTVAAKIMLYKNIKGIVCSPDAGTDFFNFVTVVYIEIH